MKKFKFTIRGQKYEVEISNFEDEVVSLEVNGTPYEVAIERDAKEVSKTPKLVRRPVPMNDAGDKMTKAAGAASKISAPLPGNIFKVLMKEGDAVKKGDKVLIMEAMKMENDILADSDGTITSLKVKEGDAVLQGDTLVEIA